MAPMDALDRRLLDQIQDDFPMLTRLCRLKGATVIRQASAIFATRAPGYQRRSGHSTAVQG